MMHMTFYWGKTVTLLFTSWKTDSWLSYGVTLLACFIFSVFYQYLEDKRLKLKVVALGKAKSSPSSIDTPLLLIPKLGKNPLKRCSMALMFGVNSAIGYLLMLAVMSFNGGVFIAVILGLAFGYFLFRCADEEELVVVDNPCACA